jgi:molybdenum cofactor sulfurtransferase
VLIIDPIKSCHAYSIPEGVAWPLTTYGLLYDREYFLISTTGRRALSQKQYPRMALIRPTLNLESRVMYVSSPSSPARLEIPLDVHIPTALKQGSIIIREDARLCADKIRSLIFTSPEIQSFFSAIVGVDCTLAMYHPETTENMRYFKPHLLGSKSVATEDAAKKREIWLSNESPYLLISQSSVDALSLVTARKDGIPAAVFRPNFIISGDSAYAEDSYRRIRIGDNVFELLGQCRRCHMVCVDPERGIKEKEGGDVYLSLGKTRRKDTGGVVFGIHMGLNGVTGGSVKVGDPIIVEEVQ